MVRPELGAGWVERMRAITEDVRDWRATHPRATFDDLETALDARLDELRAAMLQELALASSTITATADPPVCPQCGQRAWRRGTRTRTLLVQGDQPVTVERGYAVCPACRTGFFPPG